MKLCASNYNCKSVNDAKFESGSVSNFGDMTSQIFPGNKGTVFKFGYLPRENGSNLKNDDQNLPPCQFQQSLSGGKFSIFKIFGTSL